MTYQESTVTEYRQSVGSLIAAIIGGLVFASLVTLAGLIFLRSWSIPLRTNPQLVALISFSVGGVVLILMLLSALWWKRMTVRIQGSQVTIIKAFRTYAEFDAREVGIGRHVVKQSTNGIPSSTTRTLIVDHGGLEQRFVCYRFSREAFSTMVSQLQSFAVTEPQTAATPAGYFVDALRQEQYVMPVQSQGFVLNREAYSGRGRNLLIFLAILIVSVIGYLLILQFTGTMEDAFIALILAGGLGVMVIVICLIALASVAKVKRKTPRQIGVDQGGIYVEQQFYPFASLRKIRASPPHYGLGQNNSLELFALDGQRRTVLLGQSNYRSKKPVFAEYPQFIAALQGATARWPGLLILDLQ